MSRTVSLRNDIVDELETVRKRMSDVTGQKEVSYSDAYDCIKKTGGKLPNLTLP